MYRNDGLAAIPLQSGRKNEKLKAEVHRFAKGLGLQFTIEAPLISTDFLDVRLDINSQSFAPYHKPNSKILYVDANSNHPSNITKSIPKNVNDRLIKRASSKKEFEENKTEYEKALAEAGYKANLSYTKVNNDKKKNNNRKRKIMWFNPPYCMSVRTNIARKFLDLVKRHFNDENPLKVLFNKNNMRVSYCCMSNLETIIKRHNFKILNEGNGVVDESCNCRNKDQCPLKDEGISCRSTNLVYRADVITDKEQKYYIGLCEPEFKTRYRNHTSSFNLNRNVNPTLLSGYVRNLKRNGIDHKIKWTVLSRSRPIKDGGAVCRLCLKEATAIAFSDKNCLNKRNEVVHTCMHKQKFLLRFYSNAPS